MRADVELAAVETIAISNAGKELAQRVGGRLMLFWLASAALIGCTVYYLGTAATKPEVHCQDNVSNRQTLDRLPALSRRLWVTPWIFGGYLQLLWLGLRKAYGRALTYDRVDVMTMADGGTTALNWLDRDAAPEIPVIAVLHTITGSPESMRGLVRDLHQQTGWRIVLCQRRGHGELKLTSPNFNTMGNVDDLRQHVAEIQRQFPAAPLYLMGVSAGTGLLTRYLIDEGADTPVRAAFSYCPGYDIEIAFSRANPWLSRKMARKLIRQFVLPNRAILEGISGYRELASAESLQEFQDLLYPFAGFESLAAYLTSCNPTIGIDRITIPALVLNAEDDPICVAENVREHQATVAQLENLILVVTRRGTHCAHFSGWWPRPWAHHLAGSYFLAMHESQGAGSG